MRYGIHFVDRSTEPSVLVTGSPALNVASPFKLSYSRSHGVDTISVEVRETFKRIVPSLGEREHLREDTFGFGGKRPVALMIVWHDGVALDLLDISIALITR